MRNIIPVKESSFNVTVRHISSLTSVSFIVELVVYFIEKGSRCFRLYCLLVNVIGTSQTNLGQPYLSLTSKSKITRNDAMLS